MQRSLIKGGSDVKRKGEMLKNNSGNKGWMNKLSFDIECLELIGLFFYLCGRNQTQEENADSREE